MAKRTTTETFQSSTTSSTSKAHSQSQSQSQSQSTTKKLLDSELLSQILGGLAGNMTDKEIAAFAENLLRPQLNAGIEASRQNFETTKLSKEQEIANLAANLTRAIDEQNSAYRQSKANVETARLFPQGSTCLVVLWILLPVIRFHVRGFHPLWLAFPKPFCYEIFSRCAVHNPGLHAIRFRLLPFRSPLLRKSSFLSFPPAT